jgi:hypothetical protein
VLSGPTHIAQVHLRVAVQRIVDMLDNSLCTSYINADSPTAHAKSLMYVYLCLTRTLTSGKMLQQCIA